MNEKYLSADPFWGNGTVAAPPGKGLAKHWNWLKAQSGNTHPGALPPFGWVSVLPYSGGYSSGYGCTDVSCGGPAPRFLERPMAKGFTHFHTSGVGFLGEFYNYLLLTPVSEGYDASRLSPLDEEEAHPGFYQGKMSDYGVNFQLTASAFAAAHKCSFEGGRGRLTLDAAQLGLSKKLKSSQITEAITGYVCRPKERNGFSGFVTAHGVTIYFAWQITGSVTHQSVHDNLMVLETDSSEVESFIGFSRVSEEEACVRVREAAERGFEKIRESSQALWKNLLERVQADFSTEEETRLFYSALYHSFIKPVDSGTEFVDFQTLWDIYRTQLPLVMTFAPETGKKILRSMMETIERIGFFPCGYLMSDNYSGHDMQATALAVVILADGFFRKLLAPEDYPRLKKAFEAEFAHASVENKSPTHQLDLVMALFAASQVAALCGDEEYAAVLRQKSSLWRTVYDPETGLLPEDAVYYEGDHWNYSFRPHADMVERVALAGGAEKFEKLLDRFFGFDCQDEYSCVRPKVPHRFEGMNNESDMETPAAFLWCGKGAKQAQVHAGIRRNMFLNGPGGCPGNNDSGGLSSWYVWSVLGLVPQNGAPYILLGSPAVNRAELNTGEMKLLITVERTSPEAIYPAAYEFNGRRFTEPWLHLDEFSQGGVLKFYLDSKAPTSTAIPNWF